MLALSGLIHLAITAEHSLHAPAHGLFFAVLGVAQLGWAVAYWLVPSRWLRWSGLALTGGMIVLYALTRGFTAPFQDSPEEVEPIGLLSKALEAMAVVCLMIAEGGVRASPRRIAGVALAMISISVLTGGATYAAAIALEPFAPAVLAAPLEEASSETASAHSHGAAHHIRLDNAVAGGYLVRAVTSPGTDRPEDLLVEVRLLDPSTRKTVTDAAVLIRASQRDSGAAAEASAVQGTASIPRDYGARLELPTAGNWHITISITGPAGLAETSFDLQVSGGSGIGGQISAYLPFAGLFLLVAGYFLLTRVRPQGGTPPAG